jgi:hypothetical protein
MFDFIRIIKPPLGKQLQDIDVLWRALPVV